VPHRLLGFYLASACNAYKAAESEDAALDHLCRTETRGRDFGTAEQAMDWLDREAANLCAVIAEATRDTAPDLAVAADLLLSVEPLLTSGSHLWEFEQTARLVVSAAMEKRDRHSQGRAGYILALDLFVAFRLDESHETLLTVVELTRETGDTIIEAESLNGLGVIAMEQRRHDVGYELLSEAVQAFRKCGARGAEANALGNLARTALGLGRTEDAVSAAEQGLRTYSEIGSTIGVAKATYNLGIALHGAGRYDAALARYTECLLDFQRIGQQLWEQHTLYRLAESHLSAGNPGEAMTAAEESLRISRVNDHRFGQGRALVVLGRVLSELGSPDRARGCWEQALEIFEELDAPARDDVRALLSETLIAR
jgi:tetratricopeptide (TPR) repeat protein